MEDYESTDLAGAAAFAAREGAYWRDDMPSASDEAEPVMGPCMCPQCGWDDNRNLRVIDWYEEERPPIPRPFTNTIIVVDSRLYEGEVPIGHETDECPMCGCRLSAYDVYPREVSPASD